jgi:hypothetical protein
VGFGNETPHRVKPTNELASANVTAVMGQNIISEAITVIDVLAVLAHGIVYKRIPGVVV